MDKEQDPRKKIDLLTAIRAAKCVDTRQHLEKVYRVFGNVTVSEFKEELTKKPDNSMQESLF